MNQSQLNSALIGRTFWLVKPSGWASCPICGRLGSPVETPNCTLCLGGDLWVVACSGDASSTVFSSQDNRYYLSTPCVLVSIEKSESASGTVVIAAWVRPIPPVGSPEAALKVTDFSLLFEDEDSARGVETCLNYKAIGETLSRIPMKSLAGYLGKNQKKS